MATDHRVMSIEEQPLFDATQSSGVTKSDSGSKEMKTCKFGGVDLTMKNNNVLEEHTFLLCQNKRAK